MRSSYVLIYLLLLNSAIAQCKMNNFRLYGESANMPQKYSFKYSIFEEAEYGISEKLSVKGHPIMIFFSPSVSVKYNFHKENNLTISSIHGFNYPSFLMNLVKSKGTGGFISPEYKIPFLLSLRNSILATLLLEGNVFLTGILGFELALNNFDLDPGTSVDLPIILPRSMVYYKNYGFTIMISAEGVLINNFDFHFKSELFLFPFESDRYDYEYQETSNSIFWELSGNLFWNIRKSFKMGIGTRLSFGTYPFGNQWHLLPFIDFAKYID